jgi:hypothetical protein
MRKILVSLEKDIIAAIILDGLIQIVTRKRKS